ncbi:hypothetical protein QYM36_004754 [Artemia franciscana]|uniref:Uncharacterized protein n=1 Tax=Artemia franciscana TaxID=6661 RepID=A0AA88LDA6_ARTSF|nr:hypothetical protein QYM36_004754 [Artemia franciscana]
MIQEWLCNHRNQSVSSVVNPSFKSGWPRHATNQEKASDMWGNAHILNANRDTKEFNINDVNSVNTFHANNTSFRFLKNDKRIGDLDTFSEILSRRFNHSRKSSSSSSDSSISESLDGENVFDMETVEENKGVVKIRIGPQEKTPEVTFPKSLSSPTECIYLGNGLPFLASSPNSSGLHNNFSPLTDRSEKIIGSPRFDKKHPSPDYLNFSTKSNLVNEHLEINTLGGNKPETSDHKPKRYNSVISISEPNSSLSACPSHDVNRLDVPQLINPKRSENYPVCENVEDVNRESESKRSNISQFYSDVRKQRCSRKTNFDMAKSKRCGRAQRIYSDLSDEWDTPYDKSSVSDKCKINSIIGPKFLSNIAKYSEDKKRGCDYQPPKYKNGLCNSSYDDSSESYSEKDASISEWDDVLTMKKSIDQTAATNKNILIEPSRLLIPRPKIICSQVSVARERNVYNLKSNASNRRGCDVKTKLKVPDLEELNTARDEEKWKLTQLWDSCLHGKNSEMNCENG